MKNILLMVTLLFACGYLANVSAENASKRDGNSHRQGQTEYAGRSYQRINPHTNQHVLKYIPNLVGQSTIGFACTEEGIRTDFSHTEAVCINHKNSDGTLWRTRSMAKYEGSIDHIFTLINDQPVLWAQFEPKSKQVVFLSEGARNYASAHENNEVQMASMESANAPRSSTDQCASLSGTARKLCEGAGKAIPAFGGLFK